MDGDKDQVKGQQVTSVPRDHAHAIVAAEETPCADLSKSKKAGDIIRSVVAAISHDSDEMLIDEHPVHAECASPNTIVPAPKMSALSQGLLDTQASTFNLLSQDPNLSNALPLLDSPHGGSALPKLEDLLCAIPLKDLEIDPSESSTPIARKRRIVIIDKKPNDLYFYKKVYKQKRASSGENATYAQHVTDYHLSDQDKELMLVHINGAHVTWKDFYGSLKPRGWISNTLILLASHAVMSDWDNPSRIIMSPHADEQLIAPIEIAKLGTVEKELNAALRELAGTKKKL